MEVKLSKLALCDIFRNFLSALNIYPLKNYSEKLKKKKFYQCIHILNDTFYGTSSVFKVKSRNFHLAFLINIGASHRCYHFSLRIALNLSRRHELKSCLYFFIHLVEERCFFLPSLSLSLANFRDRTC